MQIELLRAWGPYSKGYVFADMPGNQARDMIAKNIGREVKAAPVSRVAPPAVDRMVGRSPQTKARKTGLL